MEKSSHRECDMLLRIRDGSCNPLLTSNKLPLSYQVTYGINVLVVSPSRLSSLEIGLFYMLSNILLVEEHGILRCKLNGDFAFPILIPEYDHRVRLRKRKICAVHRKKCKVLNSPREGFFNFSALGIKKFYPHTWLSDENDMLRRRCPVCLLWFPYEENLCTTPLCSGKKLSLPYLYFNLILYNNDVEVSASLYGIHAAKFFAISGGDVEKNKNKRLELASKIKAMMNESFGNLKVHIKGKPGQYSIFKTKLTVISKESNLIP